MLKSPSRALSIVAAIAFIAASACTTKEPAPAPAKSASTDSLPAAPLIQCAADGLWKPCNLLDRLVHAGVGAKEIDTDTTHLPVLSPDGLHYRIGKTGLLIAFYFKDSVAAKKSWNALDTLRLMPKTDTLTPWPGTVTPIRSANVITAFFGSNNAQIERVSLALRAGLPAPTKAR